MASEAVSAEAEVLEGLIFPFDERSGVEAARALLRIRFSRDALQLVNRLLRKNQRGTISAEERILLEKYLRVGRFIDVVQAKARKVLKRSGQPLLS
jgi:hypothetical protein